MAKAKRPPQGKATKETASSMSPFKRDLLCIGVLYVVTLVLFRGIIFEDKAFSNAGDAANALTWAKVGDDIRKNEGVDPLWMPNFFSGMPTFGNVHYVPHDVSYLQKIVVTVLDFFYFHRKWSWFVVYYFLSGLFTFMLLRTWKLPHVAALFGALTFMLSPYAIGLAAEGHGSKLMALSYLPLVVLLASLVFERRDVLSFGLFSAAIGTLLLTNHMQIVYYVFITLGVYVFYHIVRDWRENKLLIPKKAALFIGALAIGVSISAYIYLSVYEYAQYSIRGGGTAGATGGLTWDYATNWSFHPQEILTFLIPSFFGFSSQYMYTLQGQTQPLPLYWGTMPFNTSTVYFGVVPLLLGILALIYKRNTKTLFFAILAVVALLMSFGKHFSPLYEFLFNVLPFFNKFRAPVMILHLVAFVFAVLSAFGLSFLLEELGKDFNADKLKKGLFSVLGALGVILVLGYLMKSSLVELFGFTFSGPDEKYEPQTMKVLKDIRWEVLWKDYVKFVALIAAAIGAIVLYVNKNIKAGAFSAIIIGLLLIDLFIIDTKYIDPKPRADLEDMPSNATVEFLKKQAETFRVFPLGELYQYETSFQYFGLHSVGGYSPAKLKIYQTVVDSCFYSGPDPSFPLNMNVVNMLNAKYLVANGQLPPEKFRLVNTDEAKRLLTYENAEALPRAWFVDTISVVQKSEDALQQLNSPEFDPAATAILEKPLNEFIGSPDSAWSVSISEYKSREIRLITRTTATGLLVLSEIYYPAGWNAYVDGNPAEIYRTNYILRSVVVPSGSHEVVFKFEPKFYDIGYLLSHAGWVVALGCVVVGLWRMQATRTQVGRRVNQPSQ
jgi:hypothetical protein